ncbi:MAG: hypothetical protein HKM93_11890 [Desulfobacteraceae bacterium]|nr:hypothetical protein [Desulfobacteraceae bacterium]
MTQKTPSTDAIATKPVMGLFYALTAVGLLSFGLCAVGQHPEKAWQAYLINFLVFSAIAQGAVLFSTLMHTVGAKWSGPLSGLAESFTAFFPVSFVLFLILFFGSRHVFPWIGQDLHGKEVWLNLPFLFSRDAVGLLVLYGAGFAYLYHALPTKLRSGGTHGLFRRLFMKHGAVTPGDIGRLQSRKTVFAICYMLAFALVLSLLGYDLVMSMDPHWYSTLFGAYSFVKAIYIGFGALIILASLLHLNPRIGFTLAPSQFHDIGKLFFAFCLVWADFFYCQFVVIWYGNISEETSYIIERVMHSPWNILAWTVFFVGFIMPFIILLNKKIKTQPKPMMVICIVVILAIWLEHFLILGPSLYHGAHRIPLSIWDPLISLGFIGLMALSLAAFFKEFPELLVSRAGSEVN